MHKQLYLIRHAQAVEKNSNQTDKDRELTQTGIQEAIQIGNMLSDQKFLPEIIYASSAERAIQTAMIIANTLKFDRANVHYDDVLYEASTRTFFQFIAALDDNLHKVCCVGHNPVISYLAEYLSKAEIGDMVTGSCAIIKFDFSRWMEVTQRAGELVTYLQPSSSKNE